MRGVLFDTPGEPLDVLRFANAPAPTFQEGAAIVKVMARPIHPADLAFVRGRYRIRPELPQVAGLEGMGIVIEAPTGSGFAAGDHVAFRTPGTWVEHLAVPLSRLIRVPGGISNENACQLSLNPLTAWGLLDLANAAAGEWILMTAGTSAVANLVATLCQARRLRTIAIVRGSADEARPRSRADVVLSSTETHIKDLIGEVVGHGTVAAILDSVGGPSIAPLMAALRPGGRILAYGALDSSPATVTNAMLIYSNLTWLGFGIDRWLSGQTDEQKAGAMSSIIAMALSGDLRLPVAKSFSLDEFADAIRANAEPHRIGKILLV